MKRQLLICLLATTAGCGFFDDHAQPPFPGGSTGGTSAGPTGTPGPGFLGRYVANTDGTYDMDWSASEFIGQFDGSGISIQLEELAKSQSWPDGTSGINQYDVSVDGGNSTVLSTNAGNNSYTLASNLGNGNHVVTVRKRSEADVGTVRFHGFTVADGNLLAPPDPASHKILLVGDSITAGYGMLGTSVSCQYSPSTEDADKTYGLLAGAQLKADVTNVSWAGKGVYRNADGSTTQTIPQLYPLAVPATSNATWDASTWQADVVVINLATNDFAQGDPDASSFEGAYVSLLKQIRSDYPNATIFCCLGPMLSDNYPTGENQLSTARSYIQAAMSTFNDSKVQYLEFPVLTANLQGCQYHPNAAAHVAMGAQLATAIQQAMNW